jgi:hypothetical protein
VAVIVAAAAAAAVAVVVVVVVVVAICSPVGSKCSPGVVVIVVSVLTFVIVSVSGLSDGDIDLFAIKHFILHFRDGRVCFVHG